MCLEGTVNCWHFSFPVSRVPAPGGCPYTPAPRTRSGPARSRPGAHSPPILGPPRSPFRRLLPWCSRPSPASQAEAPRLGLPSPPFCRSPPGDPQAPAPCALRPGPLDAGEHPPTPSKGSPPPRPHAELLGPQTSGPMSQSSQFLARSPGDPPAPENWPAKHETPGLLETRGLGSLRQQRMHSMGPIQRLAGPPPPWARMTHRLLKCSV